VSTYNLKLYITGHTPKSERAIANLQRIFDNDFDDYELTVIDLLEHPHLAEEQRILATPMLIRQLPPPVRRIIGDLSDKEKVLLGLDLQRSGTGS